MKNGRVYVLPYDLFAVNPGIRAADALQVLANAMYPEDASNIGRKERGNEDA